MTDAKFVLQTENASVTATLVDGKITDKKVEFKTVTVEYDDAISFIKAICDVANLPRVKGYKPNWTYSADDNKVTVKQVKTKA